MLLLVVVTLLRVVLLTLPPQEEPRKAPGEETAREVTRVHQEETRKAQAGGAAKEVTGEMAARTAEGIEGTVMRQRVMRRQQRKWSTRQIGKIWVIERHNIWTGMMLTAKVYQLMASR